ncbi:hypothetical protein [Mycobacterium avium]|uniref:hypothetical protein n=1 Tax=Mycobacterium avium TaxID=1764 RepID=UPI00044D2E2B|nr:hypothetical protein [Mycobacterium avium]ETZ49596.1 hypothetical protein L837_0352 [Mycobacterium avium MAV_061107_1842]MBZ4501886.1 hypothetical protein [Mycobacterium avium subsp. hominissuis]MBZ4539873.1 hypothetical protein [Mycobacterium avium subsp. hominissuis]MBZ4600792.1 hypothetical protein [Mycobacterium avium subsp. hominissuis]
MRFAGVVLGWLIATLALAVAVPAGWVQLHVVDADGYAALARRAAADPALQSAMAAELTTRAMALIAEHGGGRYPVDGTQVHDAAAAFTAGPAFPPLFAQANRAAHAWLFDGSGAGGDQWAVDVAPMLDDPSIRPLLRRHNVAVPAKLTVPLTVSVPRQGRLSGLTRWGPWLSLGSAALCGVGALLTLAAARRRGKALSSLGVAALLVGAAGWAGLEAAGRYVNDALNHTTGNVRRIAEVMVAHAESGVHQWLNATLLAGAALAGLGVLVVVLGGLAGAASRR